MTTTTNTNTNQLPKMLNLIEWRNEVFRTNGARKYSPAQQEIIKNNIHLLKQSPTFGLVKGILGYMAETADDKVYDDEYTEEDIILYRYYKQQYGKYIEPPKPVKEYSNIFTFMLIPAYVEKHEEYEEIKLSLIQWGVDWENNHYNRKRLDAKRYYPQFAKYFSYGEAK